MRATQDRDLLLAVDDGPWRFSSFAHPWLGLCWVCLWVWLLLTVISMSGDRSGDPAAHGQLVPRDLKPVESLHGGWPESNTAIRIVLAVAVGSLVGIAGFARCHRNFVPLLAAGCLLCAGLSAVALAVDVHDLREARKLPCDGAYCDSAAFIATVVLDGVFLGTLLVAAAVFAYNLWKDPRLHDLDVDLKHQGRGDPSHWMLGFLAIIALCGLMVTCTQLPGDWTISVWENRVSPNTPRNVYFFNRQREGPDFQSGGYPGGNENVRLVAALGGILCSSWLLVWMKYSVNHTMALALCGGMAIITLLASVAFGLDFHDLDEARGLPCPKGYQCKYLTYSLVVVFDFLVAFFLLVFVAGEFVCPRIFRLFNPGTINQKRLEELTAIKCKAFETTAQTPLPPRSPVRVREPEPKPPTTPPPPAITFTPPGEAEAEPVVSPTTPPPPAVTTLTPRDVEAVPAVSPPTPPPPAFTTLTPRDVQSSGPALDFPLHQAESPHPPLQAPEVSPLGATPLPMEPPALHPNSRVDDEVLPPPAPQEYPSAPIPVIWELPPPPAAAADGYRPPLAFPERVTHGGEGPHPAEVPDTVVAVPHHEEPPLETPDDSQWTSTDSEPDSMGMVPGEPFLPPMTPSTLPMQDTPVSPSYIAPTFDYPYQPAPSELYPWLGIRLEDDRDPRDGRMAAVVYGVSEGGPADDGDVQPGDIITRFNGRTVSCKDDFRACLGDVFAEYTVMLEVYRESLGGLVDCEVVVGQRPEVAGALGLRQAFDLMAM